MKIRKLVQGISLLEIYGSQEVVIRGMTMHSKQVAPGFLFIAKKGEMYDGSAFVNEAIQAGAVAILSDFYDPFLPSITQLIYRGTDNISSLLANRFFDCPAKKLFVAGTTGTNGKTTTSYLIKHILGNCGLIGTVEWIVGEKIMPSTHTTPDVVTNLKLLKEMVEEGCIAAAMEVSSHALDQGRVQGIEFDAAVFTNLTLDHLDYHQTMEEYACAKAKLFTDLNIDAVAIYNIDDPWSEKMLGNSRARRLSYGWGEKSDIRAEKIRLFPEGMEIDLCFGNRNITIFSKLIGRFNVYNILAAVGVGLAFGKTLDQIVQALASFTFVPGRLERIYNSRGVHVFVDYAHTDDALRNVLETLQELKKGKIITVFGCGGDRDRSKRPKMAAVAEKLSDYVFVTSDNPRSEEPIEIIRQIIAGFQSTQQYSIEIDRHLAIQKAIAAAAPGDIVLIAGKGHEKTQVIGREIRPFDDRQAAASPC